MVFLNAGMPVFFWFLGAYFAIKDSHSLILMGKEAGIQKNRRV
jgi:hypothetical protein